ncbi:hypothetical protein [Tenacibaculum maritimum]|uniref:hypothetical protein n=1 Tax=Tenacibaculum maritimum TaxID=107401 RepID=UPI0012E60FBF|nr:hypothetical protein [Tenacibaculum maritimum]CAA0251508.1 conserved hypothetical protein [Tenacibaculum maritimum]
MRLLRKIKGGALQYVLIVSVLVAIILFAFISLVYLQQKIQLKNVLYKEAIHNVLYGFDFLQNKAIPYEEVKEYQFSENKVEKTEILKEPWGVFDIAYVRSSVKNEFFQKIGLLGGFSGNKDALYLKDNNSPLVLVGNTRIEGDALLPKEGVKLGNISGVSYNGSQLIYGNKGISTSELPKIENIEYIRRFLKKQYINDSVEYFQLEDKLRKTQLFTKGIAVCTSLDNIVVRNVHLKGKIIIQSTRAIKVAASAILEDVILIAPKVELESNTVGTFQVIASENIIVNKGCKLRYPSALVIANDKEESLVQLKERFIAIHERSDIAGIIIYEGSTKGGNFNSQITISEKAVVKGEVYCNENLELLGNVYGTVFTNRFIAKQFGSVYINHIYNGIIANQRLAKEYCGLFMENSTRKKVAKWLY